MLETPHLFDLTGRGGIVLTGKDRASFLQGLITNDVKTLTPGTGCYAAFLTPKGKMLADLTVLCMENEILIDCDPGLVEKLEGLLRKYLVFNEVEIGNRTNETAVLHVEGRGTGDFLRKVIQTETPPGRPHEHAGAVLVPCAAPRGLLRREDDQAQPRSDVPSPGAGAGAASPPFEEGFPRSPVSPPGGLPMRVVCESRGGSEGFDLRFPRESLSSVLSLFEATGLFGPPFLSPPSILEAARIDAGIPRWGAELDENVLPDEAGLAARGAISYTKGCYIGQEIVARIKTYGHVNRALVRIEVDVEAPLPGSEILFDGEKIGRVTSAAPAAATGRAIALGYVKREHAAPGTRLAVRTPSGDLAAGITPLTLA